MASAVPPGGPRARREAAQAQATEDYSEAAAAHAGSSLRPTRKWIAAQVVALAGIATSFIDSGWDDTETKLCIAVAVQALVTWLLPNESTPGGVPLKK